MAPYDVIVIGASAGGVEALTRLVRELPENLPAALLVVVHFPIQGTSYLPHIINRSSKLPAAHAVDGDEIRPQRIYIAPPNYHMLINDGKIQLWHGPREHGFRPAIDPLFRSAAREYGHRAVGVILSGTLGDGVLGLQFVKLAGGIAVVQDPEEAVFTGMPVTAIEQVEVDAVLKAAEIASLLQELAGTPTPSEVLESATKSPETAGREADQKGETSMAGKVSNAANLVHVDIESFESGTKPEGRTPLTCPSCGGAIWELREGDLVQYSCHVGHIFSSESLIAEQGEVLEVALWTAIRALEERAALLRRIGNGARDRGSLQIEARFLANADEVERNANVIRRLLMSGELTEQPTLPRRRAKSPSKPKPSMLDNPDSQ